MASLFELQQNNLLKSAVDAVRLAFGEFGIAPGSQAYAIRNACFECPNSGSCDCCEDGCMHKGKKYLEKITVSQVGIVIDENGGFSLSFTDNLLNRVCGRM